MAGGPAAIGLQDIGPQPASSLPDALPASGDAVSDVAAGAPPLPQGPETLLQNGATGKPHPGSPTVAASPTSFMEPAAPPAASPAANGEAEPPVTSSLSGAAGAPVGEAAEGEGGASNGLASPPVSSPLDQLPPAPIGPQLPPSSDDVDMFATDEAAPASGPSDPATAAAPSSLS